jgi:hypothetical protein
MIKILCTASLLMLVPFVYAQDQRLGTLKSIAGEVTISQASATRTAEVGGGVQQADRLVTGSDSIATFTLKDGTVVTVGPKSTLALDKLQFDGTTQDGNLVLNLFKGSMRVVTGWLAKLHPDQVKVITPTSVVGVRGTDFVVEVP